LPDLDRRQGGEGRRPFRAISLEIPFGGEAGIHRAEPGLRDVHPTHHHLLHDTFVEPTGAWEPTDVERIYATARDRRTWQNA
jgi:hypothetical protein